MFIQNLEECLWHGIGEAETGFVPNHVKRRQTEGRVARSSEKPEVLADHSDKKTMVDRQHYAQTEETCQNGPIHDQGKHCGHTERGASQNIEKATKSKSTRPGRHPPRIPRMPRSRDQIHRNDNYQISLDRKSMHGHAGRTSVQKRECRRPK